jgi:hypothetical protein
MKERNPGNIALWLAPLAAPLPLAAFFSLPQSPLFLGRLAGADTANVFLRPHLGPWLALAAVVFDATVLAYVTVTPLWLLLKAAHASVERWPLTRVAVLFSLAGIGMSLLVRVTQNFPQPGLREFALSWLSPLFGCLCGLSATAGFAWLMRQRWLSQARTALYPLPGAVLLLCGMLLMSFRGPQ